MKREGNNKKNINVSRNEESKCAIVVTIACRRCGLWFK